MSDLRTARPSFVRSSLTRLLPGRCGTVIAVHSTADEAQRLQVMGICNGRTVMLVRRGDPLILRVLGSRIGVSARLAANVEVEACPDHLDADVGT